MLTNPDESPRDDLHQSEAGHPAAKNQHADGNQQHGEPPAPLTKTNILSLSLSVLAAAFGVQSKRNLERDFSQASPIPFILAGVIFTVIFVVTLIYIVNAVVDG